MTRPFRAPHHSTSVAGLTGGGSVPRPGEVTLAHRGVLFLDELPELQRSALEAMRQPLEDGRVCLSRARDRVEFPAQFIFVAAMNPCPCGYAAGGSRTCECPQERIARYRGRISGPLLDRIDLQVDVLPVDWERLATPPAQRGESSRQIRERVDRARRRQQIRYAKRSWLTNAEVPGHVLQDEAGLDPDARQTLTRVAEAFRLSPRGTHRVLKVARTCADLEDEDRVRREHILEASSYRFAHGG